VSLGFSLAEVMNITASEAFAMCTRRPKPTSKCSRAAGGYDGTGVAPSHWIAKKVTTNSNDVGTASSTRSRERTPQAESAPAARFASSKICAYERNVGLSFS